MQAEAMGYHSHRKPALSAPWAGTIHTSAYFAVHAAAIQQPLLLSDSCRSTYLVSVEVLWGTPPKIGILERRLGSTYEALRGEGNSLGQPFFSRVFSL